MDDLVKKRFEFFWDSYIKDKELMEKYKEKFYSIFKYSYLLGRKDYIDETKKDLEFNNCKIIH